ncbi:hypothetical protein VPH35_017043 [Triticum aestivum]
MFGGLFNENQRGGWLLNFFLHVSFSLHVGFSGHKAWAQLLLHDDHELEFLRQVDLVAGRFLPLEFSHHVGHKVEQVKHGNVQTGADPPPDAERHHSDPQPLWNELHGLLPLPFVPPHLGDHEVHRGTLGDEVPADLHVLRCHVRQHEVHGRVLPQALKNHRLEVRHALNVFLGYLFMAVFCLGFDLLVEPLLDGLVFHQLGHDPVQCGGGGVSPGGEELRAEVDHLVVGEWAVALLGEPDVEQRVHVRVLQRGLRFAPPRLALAAAFLVLEQLLLPPAQGEHFPDASAEEVLGDRREEGEDGHLAEHVSHLLKQVEHGVLERGRDRGRRLTVVGQAPQLIDEHVARPEACVREPAAARRVQRPGDEVAAQEAPHRPVAGAGDGVIVVRAEDPGRREAGAVGQGRPALDENGVCEASVGDEDGQPRPHSQRHDGAVPPDKALEQGLRLGRRAGEP